MAKRSKFVHLTRTERYHLYERLRDEGSFEFIAKEMGCSTKSIQRVMASQGGCLPRPSRPSGFRLSEHEREEIARGLRVGESLRGIARAIGRAPSTVSREVAVLGGRFQYEALSAQRRAARLARRPKLSKLVTHRKLRDDVEALLSQRWSPQQISAKLRQEYDSPRRTVSHETIYRSLFVQSRGALRKELHTCLRRGQTQRRPLKRRSLGGSLTEMVMLSERPAEATDRAVPGHWEGDLIIGKSGKSAVATLVERHSRYVMLVGLEQGRTASCVRDALTKVVQTLPSHLKRSLTWDQGKEMAEHRQFTLDTQLAVYFCDPHSPWQRGSNENTNGLLRQYLPKGADLNKVSDI